MKKSLIILALTASVAFGAGPTPPLPPNKPKQKSVAERLTALENQVAQQNTRIARIEVAARRGAAKPTAPTPPKPPVSPR